jgi:hypothetical protein
MRYGYKSYLPQSTFALRRQNFQAKPPGVKFWYPLNDKADSSAPSARVDLGWYEPAYSGAGDDGLLHVQADDFRWSYDPRVGGYCYNVTPSGGGAGYSGPHSNVTWPAGIADVHFEVNNSISIWCYATGTNVGFDFPALTDKTFSSQLNCTLQVNRVAGTFSFINTSGAGGATHEAASTLVHELNRWYHLVGTQSATRQKLYINGELEADIANATTPDANGSNWGFGNRVDNSQGFTGHIWNVMLLDHAADQAEIRSLYRNPFDIFAQYDVPPTYIQGMFP